MGENYIYHLVQGARWKDAGGDGYLPPTYEADGFIHATKEAGLLLPVANHFYTGVDVNAVHPYHVWSTVASASCLEYCKRLPFAGITPVYKDSRTSFSNLYTLVHGRTCVVQPSNPNGCMRGGVSVLSTANYLLLDGCTVDN